MSEFPSNKILGLTLIFLFGYFGMRFILFEGGEIHQTKYDWDSKQLLEKINGIEIDSFSYNYLSLKKPKSLMLNNSYTYAIDAENTSYYFRYIHARELDSTIEFRNLGWTTDIPEKFDGKINMSVYSIPLVQKGKFTAVTIGDEWMYYNEAKYLRRYISSQSSLVFKGEKSDFYNYPLIADYSYSLDDIVEISSKIQAVDYYILFFDGICAENEKNDLSQKLQLILDNLNRKNPKKVIWITFPSIAESKDWACHKIINEAINSLDSVNLRIIDVDRMFKGDLNKYLMPDGRYLNRNAYKRIADIITDEIND